MSSIIKSLIFGVATVLFVFLNPTNYYHVDAILDRTASDGSFLNINYDDLSRKVGFHHWRHNSDLVHLAKAYISSNSKFHQRMKGKEKITTSLGYWVGHDFVGDN